MKIIKAMNILKELYEPKSRKERTALRIKVSSLCGWDSAQTFYNKMNDKVSITNLELEAIKNMK